MGTPVRELFCELVDVPRQDRKKILAERQISTEVCAELECLLSYDSGSAQSLTRCVSEAVEETLRSTDASVPRYCGSYRLGGLLGAGGMGAVYLGERRDGEIEQKVAIKFLRADADRPSWRERFLRERQFLAYLNHPSIARLLDAGHTPDGRPYLVMEYVEGVAIDEYAKTLDLRSKLGLFLLVCDGVSHAHRRLIVHRDLKPSNILVDSSGYPKLLDFGIAKLLESTVDETRTVERLLTPSYASPEQLRGDIQTTSTDIYSLGAVLNKLLTGRSPRELLSDVLPAVREAAEGGSLETTSATDTKIPRDVEHILRKALRDEPTERYASVEAFADDIRAFLESRPVRARSANIWYRTSKLLRRYRIAVAAVTITLASLFLGFNIAKHQRKIAQARLLQVRQLVTKVLTLDEVTGGMNSPTKGIHEVMTMSKEYLETLTPEAHKDQGLALELGEAYALLARAEGIYNSASSEQRTHAETSLRKAKMLVEPILSTSPDNRRALLTAARISHDRMILAENESQNDEAVAQARTAIAYLDRLLGLGSLTPAQRETAAELFYYTALAHKNLHLPEDGIRYARRSIEISRTLPNSARRLSLALSMLADLQRRTGDLEGALLAIREARATLDQADFPNETARRSAWSRVLGREGKILSTPGGISLNRPDDAIPVLQRAFDLLEEWAQNYRDDNWNRLLFASAGRELGDNLTLRDPQKALAVYDHALRRLAEVKNHPDARRGEVEILAASVSALRRLKRSDEAQERIDTAFRLLAEVNDYPAARVVPQEAADAALRALGDHLAETGQTQRAAEVYEDLLAKIVATKPDPQNDLPHALALSDIYGALAALQRCNGQPDRGTDLTLLRLDLWSHWDRKLPNNGFVRRQFESARLITPCRCAL